MHQRYSSLKNNKTHKISVKYNVLPLPENYIDGHVFHNDFRARLLASASSARHQAKPLNAPTAATGITR